MSTPEHPTPHQATTAPDSDPRRAAVRRIRARQGFYRHLTTFVLIQALLIAIWATNGAGYFWPAWPMLGWGIGLVGHGLGVFVGPRPLSEQQIRNEMDRHQPDS